MVYGPMTAENGALPAKRCPTWCVAPSKLLPTPIELP